MLFQVQLCVGRISPFQALEPKPRGGLGSHRRGYHSQNNWNWFFRETYCGMDKILHQLRWMKPSEYWGITIY